MMMNKKIKKLIVTTPQGESGALSHESRYSFNYTTGDREAEVSLLMPIRAESYAHSVLPSVFAMNKPEGFLLQKITEAFAKMGGMDDMRLLSITGGDQIGRLSYAEPDVRREKPTKPQIGLQDLLRERSTQALFDFLVNAYLDSGISGVQPKVLIPDAEALPLLDSKTTVLHSGLIVKAGGDEYPFLTQNEFLCMEAARCSGIRVPPFWLSDDGGLFVMERFDLNNGQSLGFEDMSVLTGRQPDPQGQYKYQGSYENIALAIQMFCRDAAIESQQRLFEYIALSVMVRNGDAHLKNFGLLYGHPTDIHPPVLSPLYDVVTTTVYPHMDVRTGATRVDRTLALKINKDRGYPSRRDLLRFGSDVCHVQKPEYVLDRIASAMTETLDLHRNRIDADFFGRIAAEWDSGRMSLEPARIYVGGNSFEELRTEEDDNDASGTPGY